MLDHSPRVRHSPSASATTPIASSSLSTMSTSGSDIAVAPTIWRTLILPGCLCEPLALQLRSGYPAAIRRIGRSRTWGEGDMSRSRVAGLAFLVVFVTSAFAAATASAEAPEFGRCVKVAKGTGAFKSANCTSALTGGSFEWMPGPGASNGFSTASKAGSILTLTETVGGTKIICHSQSGTGEYTSANGTAHVALKFTGCESSGGKAESAGQPEGVVLSKPLNGSLGIIKKGATAKQNKVGLDLVAEEGGALIEFQVAGLAFVVKGSVIVPVTANKMQLTSTLKFAQAKGKQKPEQFEGEAKDVLEQSINGGIFEQAGLGFESTQTNEEPIEVNPVV
jgi:hypothetical protein